MTLDGKLFVKVESGTHVAEASRLGISIPENTISITNLDGEVGTRYFSLDHIDKDGSGEDIYGWRYSGSGGATVLIVND